MFEFLAKLFARVFLFTGKIGETRGFLKPLSAEEEKYCFLKIKTGTKEEKREAENTLAEHNMRLVVHIAKKYRDCSLSEDELVGIGSLGLVKAIRTYSSEKANFSTYASRCIANEILMFFRADKKNNVCVSLSSSIGSDKDGNEISLEDVLSDGGETVERKAFATSELESLGKKIEEKLDAREKRVLSLRFGLYGELPHTQKEVARLLLISRSYVSRIERTAIEKIR